MEHMYLRALATAAAQADIAEVQHGQRRSYYLSLLGLEVKKAPEKLALDDGEFDLPMKRKRDEDLMLEDGDVDPLMSEDGDEVEGNVELDFDDFEAALAAELQLEDIEEQQDMLDTHLEGGDEGGNEDQYDDYDGRPPAAQDPSQHNFKWGDFRFTLKRRKAPTHTRGNARALSTGGVNKTGCRKTYVVRSGTGMSWAAQSEVTLDALRHWANQALRFDRQRHHIAYNVMESETPPTDIIMAQMITTDPPDRPRTDAQLDGYGIHSGDSGSSSSSN